MNQENEHVNQLLHRPNQIDQNQKIFDSQLQDDKKDDTLSIK